ncbi:MAG: metallophosphoesterase [Firmicutes bacterium]|jgi:putative phosphoesterase|nr:metallophosphoesterase [Bacillota bacterium]
MRVLVISDSHGNISNLEKIDIESFDLLIHCGDFVSDVKMISDKYKIDIEYVKGNCDYNSDDDEERILELLGHKILITHGHKYGVKYSISKLYYRALELEVDLAIFGHTHLPFDESYDGIRFINPGSISLGRGSYKSTCFIMEISEKIVGYMQHIKNK